MLLWGCQPSTDENDAAFLQLRSARLNNFTPCPRGSGSSQAALLAQSVCTRLTVPENPEDPEGRQIDLKVLIVPALSAEPEADPLVFLAGGPGQAATDLLQIVRLFASIRGKRDIILMDQRGTGDLSPLQCALEQSDPLELDVNLDELMLFQETRIRECLENLDANPQYYTTDIAIQDLEVLRTYMGYSAFNLVGGSYGSRVALAFLKSYPESSRTVIIDGIAPPAISLPLYIPRDASRALQRIFTDCESDTACNEAFPDLREHFNSVVLRLETPADFSVYDNRSNRQVEVTLGRDMFLALLRQVLYARETQRLVPYIIERAWQEDYTPLTASLTVTDMQISQTMFLSVVCNEDVTRIEQAALATEQTNAYLIDSPLLTVPILEACELWPKREIPPGYFEPVNSDRPVLILSGSLDPVTPPLWGELVESNLTNARHVVVDGYAHGTLGAPCILSLMTDFIESADLQELDFTCVDNYRRRPFFTSAGGSRTTLD